MIQVTNPTVTWDKPTGLRKRWNSLIGHTPLPVAVVINGQRHECRAPELMNALIAAYGDQIESMEIVLR